MSIRPKILCTVTVPTGGWDFKFYISQAAQYDTAVTATVAAGTYFVSGDNQADDFLYALQAAISGELQPVYGSDAVVFIDIEPDTHKIRIKFDGSEFADVGGDNDVKIAWTESDTGMYETLGFDGSADDTSTATDYPQFTADYQHAYGWYSDEDGQLEYYNLADGNIAEVVQDKSLAGNVKTQFFGESFDALLILTQIERNYLGRTKFLSDGVGYTDASVHPYNRNEPLECWWREAMHGRRFRVYRDGHIDTDCPAACGSASATGALTLTDAGAGWSTDPYRWVGRVLHCAAITGVPVITQSYCISSHTSEILTVGNPVSTQANVNNGESSYYIFDHPYETYVLDMKEMSYWDTRGTELPNIDRYRIEIPLRRYVA